MTAWQTALETALVGVARKDWVLPPGEEGELAAVLRNGQTDQSALSLLHSLAILSTYRRAGEVLLQDTVPFHPSAPAETTPVCSERITLHLHQMLAGHFADLLPLMLAQLAEKRYRVPPEVLPALLDYGRTRSVRNDLRRICGERGQWLAALNPDWNWLLRESLLDRSSWETGSAPQRLALLQQIRHEDPAGSLTLLASTWTQDKAELREQFLRALRENLSIRDEPFLETRLDDRSFAVRQAAAELLCLLPESAYTRRMQARLAALLRVERTGILRTRILQMTLPDTDDPALLRDGIKGQNTPGGLGEKASVLAQMIAAVSPNFWNAQFGLEPAQLLKAAAAGEWKNLLWQGWQDATKRHGDIGWAQALADALPYESLQTEVVMLLSPGERNRLALQFVREQPMSALLRYIPQMPAPWSMPLTQAIIERCLKPEGSAPFLAHTLRTSLAKMPPQAVQLISPHWPAFLAEFTAGLEFFYELHSDLQNRP